MGDHLHMAEELPQPPPAKDPKNAPASSAPTRPPRPYSGFAMSEHRERFPSAPSPPPAPSMPAPYDASRTGPRLSILVIIAIAAGVALATEHETIGIVILAVVLALVVARFVRRRR